MKTIVGKLRAVIVTMLFASCAVAPVEIVANTAGVGSMGAILGGAILVLVITALMPTVANQTDIAVDNTSTDAKTDAMLVLLPFGLGLSAFIGLFAWLL